MQQFYSYNQRLRDLLSDNPLLLPALSRFGISLGFGDRTVAEVCSEFNVDCHTVLTVFNFISGKQIDIDPTDISIDTLMKYLKSAHSYFLEYQLPAIRKRMIEAIGSNPAGDITLALLRFYDEYVGEVRRHMAYEDSKVFGYVEKLMAGEPVGAFSINSFKDNHRPIAEKVNELKELLICHFTADIDHVDLLNSLLFDLVICERDLIAHCRVEDQIFIPAIELLEREHCSSKNRVMEGAAAADNSAAQPELDANGDVILTPRERDIITCIARGQSNKEIADSLCLSVHTVATHRRNISTKLNIHSTSGLTIFAVLHGLVDLNDGKELIK